MKRILLAALVLIGLQTQAQINYCDSMIVNGPQNQPIFEVVGVNTFIDYWVTTSNDGVLFQEDSMSTFHMVYNFGTQAYDTLTTCISYTLTDTVGYVDTLMCCFSQYWDGSSWTEITEINSIRDSNAMSAGGTSTAVIYFGGNYSPGAQATNEIWNGSSWTEVGDLNTARQDIAGCGTQTAALSVGGGPGSLAITELWNGSGWTEVADLNQGRENVKSQSAGTSTASIMWGGYNDPAGNGYALNESWNGSSWTQVADDIDGEDYRDESGYSVAMSSDGTRIAIGAYRNDGNDSDSGHVRVYEYKVTTSNQ
mgnify:CR=1 FL=1